MFINLFNLIVREFAVEYYKKADNPEKLVECYIMLKDYESLASLAKSLPGNHPLLETISVFFNNSGITQDENLDQNVWWLIGVYYFIDLLIGQKKKNTDIKLKFNVLDS